MVCTYIRFSGQYISHQRSNCVWASLKNMLFVDAVYEVKKEYFSSTNVTKLKFFFLFGFPCKNSKIFLPGFIAAQTILHHRTAYRWICWTVCSSSEHFHTASAKSNRSSSCVLKPRDYNWKKPPSVLSVKSVVPLRWGKWTTLLAV